MALGQLTVRLGLDAADFVQGISRSEAEAQRFARKIAKDISDAANVATLALGTFAVGATAALAFVADQVDSISSFQELSEKIGDTAEALASIKKASDVSGTSFDSIAAASIKLTAALSKTDEEGQGAAKAIKALGLDFNDFKALAPVDQIDAVAKAMNGFEDGANKTAVAVALWGKSGADMIPLLNDLAEGSERQITLTQDQIKAADDFAKAITRLKSDTSTLFNQLAAQVIPTLQDLFNAFTRSSTEAEGASAKARVFADVMEYLLKRTKETVNGILDFSSALSQSSTFIGGYISVSKALLSGNLSEARAIGEATRAEMDKISARYKTLQGEVTTAGESLRGKGFSDPRRLDAPAPKQQLSFSGIKETKEKSGGGGAAKQSEADKYLANLQKQLEATDKLTVSAALLRDLDLGRLGVVVPAQREQLLLIAQQIDAVKAKELADRTAAEAAKQQWDLEKKSILENFKSYDDAERAKAALGESLRLSVQTQTEELVAQETQYKAAIDAKIISQETFERLMGKVRERYEALSQPLINFNNLAKTGVDTLASGLAENIVQGKSLGDVFKRVRDQIKAMIIQALIFKAIEIGLNAVVPGLGTAIAGKRAAGGPVGSGKTYLVGEKGPELFTPGASGKITSNAETFRSQGRSAGGMTNVYNISAPGVSREEFTAGLNRSQAGAVSDVRDNKLRRRA